MHRGSWPSPRLTFEALCEGEAVDIAMEELRVGDFCVGRSSVGKFGFGDANTEPKTKQAETSVSADMSKIYPDTRRRTSGSLFEITLTISGYAVTFYAMTDTAHEQVMAAINAQEDIKVSHCLLGWAIILLSTIRRQGAPGEFSRGYILGFTASKGIRRAMRGIGQIMFVSGNVYPIRNSNAPPVDAVPSDY